MINLSKFNLSKQYKIIFLGNDSNYSKEQAEKLNSRIEEFADLDTNLIIPTNLEEVGLQIQSENSCQLIILDGNDTIIWQRADLSFKDLGQVCIDFLKNFFEDTSDSDIFKWGNKIVDQGDYMCNDCGFILTIEDNSEFKIGMAFPICDVCQAGEPEGPSGPSEPFWQKI